MARWIAFLARCPAFLRDAARRSIPAIAIGLTSCAASATRRCRPGRRPDMWRRAWPLTTGKVGYFVPGPTALGENLWPWSRSGAHKTLAVAMPCPCYQPAKRPLDRHPFERSRPVRRGADLDVTEPVAKELGFYERGSGTRADRSVERRRRKMESYPPGDSARRSSERRPAATSAVGPQKGDPPAARRARLSFSFSSRIEVPWPRLTGLRCR